MKCFKCGRALSNPESIAAGMGEVCRAKSEFNLTGVQDPLRCHHGLSCFNPRHAGTCLWRFKDRLQVMIEQVSEHVTLPAETLAEIDRLVKEAGTGIGLDKPLLDSKVPATVYLPIEKQAWWAKFTEQKACPFGLQCADPQQTTRAIWNILSLLKYQVELVIRKHWFARDWSWDEQLYENLAGVFDVLGEPLEAEDIRRIVKEQKKSRAQRLRERRLAAVELAF